MPAIFFLAFGAFLTWVALTNWRHRHEEKISLLEAAILKTTGEEPLPLTRFDRWLQMAQVLIATIFGPVLLVLGVAMLIEDLGTDL